MQLNDKFPPDHAKAVTSNPPAPRAKRGFSEDLIQECLRILESGDIDEKFEIIPRLGVLRDLRFRDPLIRLLKDEDFRNRQFAAYAMGAIGSLEFLEPLRAAFLESDQIRSAEEEEVFIAVTEAIGAVGDDAAADFFLPVLQLGPKGKRINRKIWKPIVESIGAIAQQGGTRSTEVLLELTDHTDNSLRAHALAELCVAYWHRPNEIPEQTIQRIYALTSDEHAGVVESALAALQSLADVGCQRAEKLFPRLD